MARFLAVKTIRKAPQANELVNEGVVKRNVLLRFGKLML